MTYINYHGVRKSGHLALIKYLMTISHILTHLKQLFNEPHCTIDIELRHNCLWLMPFSDLNVSVTTVHVCNSREIDVVPFSKGSVQPSPYN